MILYHVCFAEYSEGDLFVPRVPGIRAFNENANLKRICLSRTISGAISAVPWGGKDFEDMMIDTSKGYRSYPIKVYEFDTKDIEPCNIIAPKELYQSDSVRDAIINEEYWVINQTLKPKKSYFISVDSCDYEEEWHDNISYENSIRINELEENDEDFDYEDFVEGTFTSISIEDYEILDSENIVVNDTFEIPISSINNHDDLDKLKELIESITKDYLVLNNDVMYVDISNNIIEIATHSTCTIDINDLVLKINENL